MANPFTIAAVQTPRPMLTPSAVPGSGPNLTTPDALPGQPKKSEIPGVGTLKTYSKKPVPAPAATATVPDLTGVYERTGVKPAPELTASKSAGPTLPGPTNGNNGVYKDAQNNVFEAGTNRAINSEEFKQKGYNIDHINPIGQTQLPAAPKFGAAATAGESAGAPSILDTYKSISDRLGEISKSILENSKATPEEQQLGKDLLAKKAELDKFDTETLSRAEAYSGQGRGQTLGFVALNQTKDARTRAIQRLGLSQDVTGLTNQLSLSQDERKNLTDAEKTQYDLAGKQMDLALGISKEMDRLDQQHKDDARQYLLDVVQFAKGKSFDELDAATQAQITQSVADSPITLGMIKTALENSSGKLTYETREIAGRVVRFGFDDKGKEVSKIDLGDAGAPGNNPTGSDKDIFGDAEKVIQQYKTAEVTRDQIEQQYINKAKSTTNPNPDPNTAIPIEVQKALDKVYGQKAGPSSSTGQSGYLSRFWDWATGRQGTPSTSAAGE